jgi:hypothetical protein
VVGLEREEEGVGWNSDEQNWRGERLSCRNDLMVREDMSGWRILTIGALLCVGVALSDCALRPEPPVGKGVIRGIVADSLTGKPLAKASVVLGGEINRRMWQPYGQQPRVVYGSRLGVPTDDSGRFEINNVAAGKYDVTASCFEYGGKRVEGVNIVADSTVKVRFELAPSYLRLDRRIHCEGDSGADTAGRPGSKK